MGNKKSRVIEVDNIQTHLSKCQDLGRRNCPVYGPVHFIRYNGMQFLLGEAQSSNAPPIGSLHYLVPPNLLLIPEFTLLENTHPETVDELIDVLVGVAELCRDCEVGVGKGRIGFAGKWGLVGERGVNWAYQEVFKNPQLKGVYLSPQLMLSLSQEKVYPKHNPKKSDMFSLGIMLLEVIFQQSLETIFDYSKHQMKLKPILQKLSTVKQHFGEALYNIILKMVELQEQDRGTFQELLDMIDKARNSNNSKAPNPTSRRASTATDNSNYDYSSVRTPTKMISPLRKKNSVVIGGRNNCSPAGKVGCFMDNVRTPQRLNRVGKTPQRANHAPQQVRVSPFKRDMRINTRFNKENVPNMAYMTNRSPGVRKQGVSPLSRR